MSDADLLRKNQACAEVLLRQTQDRIRFGGDDNYRFAPLKHARRDGTTTPLFHTGTFLASVNSGADLDGCWVGSPHPGARLFQLGRGSHGVGVSLPSFSIPSSRKIRVKNMPPREWLRISPVNEQELVRTFVEA